MHAAASPASRARLEAQCAKRGECSCPLLQVEQGGAGLEALQKADDAAGRRRTIVHIYPLRDAHFNRALRRRWSSLDVCVLDEVYFVAASTRGSRRQQRWRVAPILVHHG